jgi:8-oxo-dGTP diphosphatase
MRKTAACLLFDTKKRVLLMHRTFDAPVDPDYWGFFGGGLEKGETVLIAAKRELMEELGIISEMYKFKTFHQTDRRGEVISHVFIGKLNYSVEQLKVQQKEGQGLGIFSLADLKSTDILIEKNDILIIEEVIKSGRLEKLLFNQK